MLAVAFAERLGDEQFVGLADQFCARLAEELFGLCVDDLDLPVGVVDHHRIGSRLDHVPKPGLGRRLRLLRVPAGGVSAQNASLTSSKRCEAASLNVTASCECSVNPFSGPSYR